MIEPIVAERVGLLNGDQVIEVGIRDGCLVAMVPGTRKLIHLRAGCRLRVVVSCLEPRNGMADITTYSVTDHAVEPEKTRMTDIERAVSTERERCAKIADAEAEKAKELMRAFCADDTDLNYHEWHLIADVAAAIAAAIRKGDS